MYEININVLNDGTINSTKPIIKLGTHLEVGRTKFLLLFDEEVKGNHKYIKFVHKKATFMKKVAHDNSLVVPPEVLRYKGSWLLSVIVSNNTLTTDLKGEYLYISEPYEAVVMDGITDEVQESLSDQYLREIVESTIGIFEIPTYIKKIGDNFMYHYKGTINLKVHREVLSIGNYAFKESLLNSLEFESDSLLESIGDYSFQDCIDIVMVEIPKSVSTYGRYIFSGSNVRTLTFEEGSNIKHFGSYAFTRMALRELNIPSGVLGFNGSGQTISYCFQLTKLTIPKSFEIPIQAYHLRDNDSLTNIVLEKEFDCDANFSTCNLTKDSMEKMIDAIKDISQLEHNRVLVLGSINLSKLEQKTITLATTKGWSLS